MTLGFVAFAMPFVVLVVMAALGAGIAWYNRRPEKKADGVQLSWHFEEIRRG